MYAARGVGLDIIAEMVERTEKTVREWLSEWRRYRLGSVVTGHAGNENAAKLKRAQKEKLEEILSKPPSESRSQGRLLGRPGPQGRRADRIRSRVQVGLLLPAAHALPGNEFQAPRPLRQAPRRGGHHQADDRDPAPGRRPPERRLGGLHRRRGPRRARGRDKTHVAPQRKEDKTVRGPREGEPVVLRGTEPDDQEDEDLPHRGKPEHRADHPHDGPPPTRDRGRKEDRRRPGQRQVPPRQGPDRPLRPRPGPGTHNTHLPSPLRPRPWVPRNTCGTPPRTTSPTSNATPRRKPSRPSPPTSPTAPSTTTSSTSQSHNHTPILFNSSHISVSISVPASRRRILIMTWTRRRTPITSFTWDGRGPASA